MSAMGDGPLLELSVTHNREWHYDALVYLEYVGAALKPLRLLTFADLSAEVAKAGEGHLPCAPYCAADKAAVFEALQQDLKRQAAGR